MAAKKPLPFTLQFREMSRRELRDYFKWFIDVLPQKVSELGRLVKQTSGFEAWEPDSTPASLDRLGEWFALQVEMRNRTHEEIQAIRSGLAFPIDVSNRDLTDRTFFLAMIVGMYFSQVFLKNHASVKWEQPFGSKRFAEYGQPVIDGFGPIQLNPMRIAMTLAYGFADHSLVGARLREVYDIWSEKVKTIHL